MQDPEGCEKKRMTVLVAGNGRICGGKVGHLLIKGLFFFFLICLFLKGGIRGRDREIKSCDIV